MTLDSTIQLKMQKEKQEHELRLALINAFAKDPELKYYVGVAVGAGVAAISSIFDAATAPGDTGGSSGSSESSGTWVGGSVFGVGAKVKVGWDWLLPAAAAISPAGVASNVGLAAISSWLMGTPEGQEAAKELGWPQTAAGVLALGAAGFAGFAMTIIFIGLGNPESLNHLSVAEAGQRITFIVTATVYFMVHLIFAEIGAIPSNLIMQFFKNR